MHADMFVVRHAQSGAPHLIARHVKPGVHVINAGDAATRTPRRACSISTPSATTRRISRTLGGGGRDLLHLRVARLLIHGLTTLGVPEVRVIGPKTLAMPAEWKSLSAGV